MKQPGMAAAAEINTKTGTRRCCSRMMPEQRGGGAVPASGEQGGRRGWG